MEEHEYHPNSSDVNVIMSRHGIGIGAVGLGDAIKALTNILGIRPCTGCEKRAAKLNNFSLFRWLVRKEQR